MNARFSPRGDVASRDPPYPRPIYPPFTGRNPKFIHCQINVPFDVCLHT